MSGLHRGKISIQVCLSGYSFKVDGEDGERFSSAWLEPGTLFSRREFRRSYTEAELSLFTPKCALVPEKFFAEGSGRELLSATVPLDAGDSVRHLPVTQYGAVLLYCTYTSPGWCDAILCTLRCSAGERPEFLPEMYYLLRDLSECGDYNKILASFADGWLYLAIAQGRNLQLANVYRAMDFTTAEYFIFTALKSLQLNPEMSTIRFRTPLEAEQEMSLYRYFRCVERI